MVLSSQQESTERPRRTLDKVNECVPLPVALVNPWRLYCVLRCKEHGQHVDKRDRSHRTTDTHFSFEKSRVEDLWFGHVTDWAVAMGAKEKEDYARHGLDSELHAEEQWISRFSTDRIAHIILL